MTVWQSASVIIFGLLAAALVLRWIVWPVVFAPIIEWALQKYAAYRVSKERPEWLL